MPKSASQPIKQERLRACTNAHGLFTIAAVDHRTPLHKAIAAACGPQGQATTEDMAAFKSAVTRILGPHASAILLDPEYSLPVIHQRPPQAGLILAYERTGYESTVPGRLPTWSGRRLAEAGAHGLKVLLYYNPFDNESINEVVAAGDASSALLRNFIAYVMLRLGEASRAWWQEMLRRPSA